MQKFRVFFNKIVQQASGETGEVEIVRSKFAKWQNLFKPIFCLTHGKVQNLCQPNRQAETSFDQPMGEVKTTFSLQVKRTRGKLPNLCKPNRQAETSFDKPMGEIKQLSVCKQSEQGAKFKTFANQAGRLKQVSISQWVKLNNFQFASEANKGRSPKPLPTKQAG